MIELSAGANANGNLSKNMILPAYRKVYGERIQSEKTRNERIEVRSVRSQDDYLNAGGSARKTLGGNSTPTARCMHLIKCGNSGFKE